MFLKYFRACDNNLKIGGGLDPEGEYTRKKNAEEFYISDHYRLQHHHPWNHHPSLFSAVVVVEHDFDAVLKTMWNMYFTQSMDREDHLI